MSWIVSLNLGSGNLQVGCEAITARVSADDATSQPLQIRGSLPPAPEIARLYRQWKLLYQEFYRERSWHSIREIKIESGGVTYFSEVEFNELCQQLIARLNEWLNAESFHIIDRKLSRILDPQAEIKVIIETNDPILRRLPWHLWNFFEDYPQAEVALSTLEYGRVSPSPRQRDTARILAVFGNDRDLDLAADRQAIENLPHTDTTFLESPQLKELNQQLWDKTGWDILFFAGHSQTETSTGQIFINESETISLEQLRHGLKKAIARGLKLAIFNSCDGLGLAQSLADLQIPQVIVMRESLPDRVAQEFFSYFLAALARGESLYAAVREARERVEPLETEYPCATWLPVICHNPATESLTWNDLVGTGDRSVERRGFNFAALLLASLIAMALVTGLQRLGLLQSWELATYDRFLTLRPPEEPDPRLLIIGITETDVQNQDPSKRLGNSIGDLTLLKLLSRLQSHQPKVIGLDIYREFFTDVEPNLVRSIQAEKLITVCEVGATEREPVTGTKPFPYIDPERSSFSDFPVDDDGKIRRQLLGMSADPNSVCTADIAFSLKIAQAYLRQQGINIQRNEQQNLQINDLILNKLDSQGGGYRNLDNLGYQILLNYRTSSELAKTISLTDIMKVSDRDLAKLVRDRIILIGTIAPSFKDYHPTPVQSDQMPGVVIHAHMVSQIISAVEDDRSLIKWLPECWENVLVSSCAFIVGLGWCYLKTPKAKWIFLAFSIVFIPGVGYVAFLRGLWLPLVSRTLITAIATVAIVTQIKIARR